MKDTSDFDVVVIGAGAAGLSATSELLKKSKSVTCIEATNKIGGRCYTDNSIFDFKLTIFLFTMFSIVFNFF